MTTQVDWNDGTGDKITLTYSSAEGTQVVAVSSAPNNSTSPRTKVVTFSASGMSPQTLSVTQAGVDVPLPSGAIPCEMVYTDGYTNFIESGLTPATSASWKIDFVLSAPSSTASTPFGYMISNKRYAPSRIDNNKRFEIAYDGYYTISSVSFTNKELVATFHCDVIVTQTGASIDVTKNGVALGTGSVTYNETDYTPNQTIGILARKSSATAGENGSFRGGIMRLKYYDDNHFGHLAADFIPCYYNNQFGLWDAVGEVFKTAQDSTKIYGFGAYWNTAGFKPNCRNSSNTSLIGLLGDYRGEVASPIFEIPSGCTSIRFNGGAVSSSANYSLLFMKSDKTYKSHFNYNTEDRVVSVPSDAAYVRLSMGRDLINTCYIYDVTHGSYIWKGISVV